MTAVQPITATDLPGSALWLVCAPHGWAWGWGGEHLPPDVFTEGAWPEGEPPLAFPAELWRPLLHRASQSLHSPIDVHVLCASWGRESAPHWWPHRKAGVRQWQDWLATQGGQLQSVAQAQADLGAGELKTWVQQSRWQRVIQMSPVSQDAQGHRSGLLLALSTLTAVGVHALMVGVWQPLWVQWRDQATVQAEQQRQQDRARQAEAAAESRRAEQLAHLQLWRQEQQVALQPLRDLGRWLQQLGPDPQAQLWLELRHAKGHWTVLGVAAHEMSVHELLHTSPADPEPVLIQSVASTWPPEPAWGWPAWRFEWQAPTADPQPEPVQPALNPP